MAGDESTGARAEASLLRRTKSVRVRHRERHLQRLEGGSGRAHAGGLGAQFARTNTVTDARHPSSTRALDLGVGPTRRRGRRVLVSRKHVATRAPFLVCKTATTRSHSSSR